MENYADVFQYTFGRKVTVIIDCLEVFINKLTNLLARAQTFASYNIGVTPQGTVSFVSEALTDFVLRTVEFWTNYYREIQLWQTDASLYLKVWG